MKLLLLPIEPIDLRYTEQWTRWWSGELTRLGWDVHIAPGRERDYSIEHGEFLDAYKTWQWKGEQLALASHLIERAGKTNRPFDVVLNLDGWGPASMAMPYIRDVAGANFKYAMFWHAGAIDETDLLARKLTHYGVMYGQVFDMAMLSSADLVFCCSDSQKAEIEPWTPNPQTLVALGNPINTQELHDWGQPVPWNKRERVVLWPHRHAPEKQWHLFAALREVYERRFGRDDAKFVYTRDVCKDKEEYYRLLGRSRAVVSFALQENFGTCVHEALALGCATLMPERKVYREIGARYEQPLFGTDPFGNDDLDEAASLLNEILNAQEGPQWNDHCDQCVERASEYLINLVEVPR